MIPECLGRFPLRVRLHTLAERDIVDILTNLEGGIVEGYTSIFQKKGVNLSITEDAVKFIAKRVINMNIGARGAQMILQPIIDDAIYEIEDYSAIEIVNIGYCKNSDTIGFTKVLKAA
jgi:ATP-dependent protease Clp ATPase subunit